MSKNTHPVKQKSISELAVFLKNLIPLQIPETYKLKPMFENIAHEDEICEGVIAYRDFLLLFCDKLQAVGDSYFSLKKKPSNDTDYPFLYIVTDLISDIGFYGEFSNCGKFLLLKTIPSFTAFIDVKGKKKKAKNPVTKLANCLHFLALCGFTFSGIDLNAKKVTLTEGDILKVSYPRNPNLLKGLKCLAIADIELRTKRYKSDYNHDNLIRCDYRLLKEEDSNINDTLRDFLQSLPSEVQNFVLDLHQHYLDIGMTCASMISTFETHFSYAYIKNSKKAQSARDIYQKRTWSFSLSTRDDYCLIVRTKKTDKYPEVVVTLPQVLQEKIERGYGCDRKMFNEPCKRSCQGIRLPLDESILEIRDGIKTWLDKEISFKIK
jgi:hypothetical protein